MFLLPVDDLTFIEQALGESSELLRNKKIFLTGATGFIGKSLLETLLWLNKNKNLNLEILSISRSPELFFKSYPHFIEHSEFQLFSGDICEDMSHLDLGPLDFVIHAAADVMANANPISLMRSCVDGTSNVLKIAKEKGCKQFLLLSSGAVYGKQPSNISCLSESYIGGVHLSSPQSAYPLGKQVSEWLVQQFNDAHMEIKVARCFAFVGPYLPLDKHFAIGNFIQAALRGQNIEITGDGTPLRTYLYTSDLCLWLFRILFDGSPGGIWNVGGDTIFSIRELAEIVREELNPGIKIRVHKLPSAFMEKYVPDITRINVDFELFPKFNIRQAVQKTAQWNLKYANTE